MTNQIRRCNNLMLRVALSAGLLLAGIVVVPIVEQWRSQAKYGEVLSAYLADELEQDTHDWGAGHGIQVILQREAQRGSSRWRWCMFFDRQLRFSQAAFTTRLSFVINNAIGTDVRVDLHLPKGVEPVFLSRGELESGQFRDLQQRFPRSLGYIAVSHLGISLRGTEAIFYVDHFCPLCGGGGFILMRKVHGVWRVEDQHGTWAS